MFVAVFRGGRGKQSPPCSRPHQLRGQPRAPRPRPYSVSLCWEGAAEPLLDPVPLAGLQPRGSFGRRVTRSRLMFSVCVAVTASSGRGEGGVGRSGLCPDTGPGGEHWFGFLSLPWCLRVWGPGVQGRQDAAKESIGASSGSTVLPCRLKRWVPAEAPPPSELNLCSVKPLQYCS